jgi:PAS domain S-box-containing protein
MAEISPTEHSSQAVGITATLMTGEPTSGQSIVERRDGSSRHVWVTASPFSGPDGRLAGAVGTAVEMLQTGTVELQPRSSEGNSVEELSAGREAAARVEASGEINRTLFEHASDGFMVTSPTGRLQEVNASWLRMFGYTHSETMTLSLEDLFDPEELAGDPVRYDHVARTGSLIRRRRMKRKDGSIFPGDINATWFSGKHILTIVRDISARVQAEEELRASEAKYRGVVENAGDGIVLADRNGRVIDGNRRVLEMVGYTHEEAYGMLLVDFLASDDAQARPSIVSAPMERGPVLRERTLRRKDGTELQVEVNTTFSPEGIYIGFIRDLSERKRSDRELQASEENYRRIVELSPDAIIVHVSGVIVYANDAAVRLMGATGRDQLIGRSPLQFLDPEYRDRAAERIDRVLKLGLPAPLMEERCVRVDGSTVDVETLAIPLDYQGKSAVQVVVRDISARKRGEEALRSSEERYRGIVERATDAIFLLSEDGMLTDANPATLAITGWSLEEIASRRFIELVHPDDRQGAEVFFLSSLDEAQREAEVFRIGTPSGAYVYLEMMTTPVIQQSGGRALFAIGRDITAARMAELQIRFQANLLAHVRNAVIATDEHDVILYWNHYAELLYGWSMEEALGRKITDVLFPGRPGTLDRARAELAASGGWEGETKVLHQDGRELAVFMALAPILDDAGSESGSVGISFDVSKLHEAERELEQARRLSSLGRLAATVAHEFNNVMMGIYPFAEIIRRSGDPQQARASAHVTQALQRGKQITQDILKFARASEPLLAPVDVGVFLRDAIDELRTIGGSAVTVEVEMPDGCYMMADAHQIQQVLSNLVANGRDAMQGGGNISIEVSHCAEGGPQPRNPALTDMIRISVRDNGCGIPESELALIFEPMFTTKRSTGTGLGLAVVHQIIARHGGEVIVESTPGVGTSFHLMIPKSPAPDAVRPSQENPVLSRPSRLLLVEDDPNVAAGITAVLEIEGIDVSLVTLGLDAAGEIERFAPDAVILDVGLPDIDGLTVFAEIIARWPDLPVVFSTGHGDEDLLEDALKRPHVGYLLKPYGVEDLLKVLTRII